MKKDTKKTYNLIPQADKPLQTDCQYLKCKRLLIEIKNKRNNPSPSPIATMDASIPEDDEITQVCAEMDASLAECGRKKFNIRSYLSKLRLLSSIHTEIADKLNEMREAQRHAYKGESDKYIPAGKENFASQAMDFMTCKA